MLPRCRELQSEDPLATRAVLCYETRGGEGEFFRLAAGKGLSSTTLLPESAAEAAAAVALNCVLVEVVRSSST